MTTHFPAARQVVTEARQEILGLMTLMREDVAHIRSSGVVTHEQVMALIEQVNAAEDELDLADANLLTGTMSRDRIEP